MHKLAVKAVVEHCRKRAAGGDCPEVEALPVETLEDAILELSKEPMKLLFDKDWLRHGIARDADEDPQAGESHYEQANDGGKP